LLREEALHRVAQIGHGVVHGQADGDERFQLHSIVSR
jgi:hypothetical protein